MMREKMCGSWWRKCRLGRGGGKLLYHPRIKLHVRHRVCGYSSAMPFIDKKQGEQGGSTDFCLEEGWR